MNRRNFVRLGALALSPILVKSLVDWSSTTAKQNTFDIEILSDAGVGHLLWQSQDYEQGTDLTTDYLIVGGGIAGLSAAYELRHQDFLLCELSETLGGSSASNNHKDQHFAQGAHYDLAYPKYYGKELLKTLFDLDIIDFDYASDMWQFVDKQFLIPHDKESRTYVQSTNNKRAEVLPNGDTKDKFEALLRPFVGKMPMPTNNIAPALHYLNELTFADYLQEHLPEDAAFLQAIDYAMLDDWGGTAQQVSALAGIHYYTCRPYFDKQPELFSPPEGNAYFAQKFISKVPQERLHTQHLVRQIEPLATGGFRVEVVQADTKKQLVIHTKNIIYAAHKHALKYIYPAAYPQFSGVQYAPWIAINIVLDSTTTAAVFWQNEYLAAEQNFMGFVDSASQFKTLSDTRRTLTAYYCLSPKDRNNLLEIDKNAPALVEQTIQYVEKVLGEPIRKSIEKVYVKVMGHAMPIPIPNYLLQDYNQDAMTSRIAYAGVDTGRLPLFFEAADSGLQAARLLLQESSTNTPEVG